jgi:DDE superfamily endonuclease
VPSYCPRSSLPAKALAWLAARLAQLAPPRRPGQGGTQPLAIEVRLDAVAAVLLDGLSYRRAGRVVGISKTEVGEAVCVDGLATRVQRPRSWANQKVLYDAKRHTHTAQGLAVSTIWGDLLWVDGGWPGSCHEHELLGLAGLAGALDEVEVVSLLDRGFRGWPRRVSTGMRRSGTAVPRTG